MNKIKKIHGVFQYSYSITESAMIGGHHSGIIAYPIIVAELEDGTMKQFPIEEYNNLIKGMNDGQKNQSD